MKIVWSQNAYDSLDKNITYLKKYWSYQEVVNFLNIVDDKITTLKQNPNIGVISEVKSTLRELVITKQIKLFYEVDDVIYLHLFWLNYNDPKKLQMLFS